MICCTGRIRVVYGSHTRVIGLIRLVCAGMLCYATPRYATLCSGDGLFEHPFFSRVSTLHREDAFDDQSKTQLHQWALWRTNVCTNRHAVPLPDSALKAWRDTAAACITSPSALEKEAAEALRRLGVRSMRTNYICAEGLSIDLVVDEAPRAIAVEVDGPVHFVSACGTSGPPPHGDSLRTCTRNGEWNRFVDGSTQLKRRLLVALGWPLVSLEGPMLKAMRTADSDCEVPDSDCEVAGDAMASMLRAQGWVPSMMSTPSK